MVKKKQQARKHRNCQETLKLSGNTEIARKTLKLPGNTEIAIKH